jgi:hypothetical protein
MLLDRLPRSGMTRNGTLYLRPRSAPRISGSASSLWPTPNTSDGMGSRTSSDQAILTGKRPSGAKVQVSLRDAIRRRELQKTKHGLWTTPTADDTGHRKDRYAQGGTALSTQAGGQLNPTWVEWLMGFPLGHTDLEPSATPSSRKSRNTSGG